MASRSSRVRTFKVDPENLSDLNLSAAEIPVDFVEESTESQHVNPENSQTMKDQNYGEFSEILSDDEMAEIMAQAAIEESQAAAKKAAKKIPQIKLTLQQANYLSLVEWAAPLVESEKIFKPEGTGRANACANALAYRMIGIVLKKRSAHLAEIAKIWFDQNRDREVKNRGYASVLQTAANRMQTTIIMREGIISLV